MSEGAKSPAALRGQGGPVHACVYVCVREGVTTGQPLASEPVDLIGQKKTCPLVEPSLAAAWPSCPL